MFPKLNAFLPVYPPSMTSSSSESATAQCLSTTSSKDQSAVVQAVCPGLKNSTLMSLPVLLRLPELDLPPAATKIPPMAVRL